MTERGKQLKRIRQYIRRREQKGFKFEEQFKESIGKKSLSQLKNLTPEKILKKSKAISPVTGKLTTGTKVAKQYRSLASKKGWETRREREAQKQSFSSDEYLPDEGEMAWNRIMQLIDALSSGGAMALRKFMDRQISMYGKDKIIMGLAMAPDEAVQTAEQIIYNSDSENIKQGLARLGNLISGAMLTEEEAQYIGEAEDAEDSE